MKKVSLKFIFPLIVLIFLIVLLSRPIGVLPAFGEVLNPYTGVIQNDDERIENQTLLFEGRNFQVAFDKNRVPHVFSDNEKDMHFAQGYVTASDRLWQMDFMARASAGRLAEVLGKDYLGYDRVRRRYAMLSSAKKMLTFIESNPLTKQAMDNYTAGVNAYIAKLNKAELPFEYKLLGYEPEPWTNLKSVLIIKYVGSMLTGYEEDINSSHMLMALGKETFFKLYPDYRASSKNDSLSLEELMNKLLYEDQADYSFLNSWPKSSRDEFDPRLGSNAWAINGKKSSSGNPILCNDPHLNLTFPSIWYEIQLKSNERNVYGYSIPGTPGVIIGFNEDVAWGVTNGSADILDWYKLQLKDDYSAYLMDGKWKKTTAVVEEIVIRDASPFYDTVYYTEHGPIVITDNFNEDPEIHDYAMNWILHEESNEFLAVLKMNKAKNIKEFEKGVRHFECPSQNFVYADKNKNIGYFYQGKFRLSEKRGDGKFIRNGTLSKDLIKTYIPFDSLPNEINPDRNFVYSANNNPWDSTTAYYSNGYFDELRADKIYSFLDQSRKFDCDYMKKMQLDNTNRLAELALPELLKHVKNQKSEWLAKLKSWNGKYELSYTEPLFFDTWWNLIEYTTWDEVYKYDKFYRFPDDLVLLDLIKNEPNSPYFESKDGPNSLVEIVNRTFQETVDHFSENDQTIWADTNKISISHLTQVEALGIKGLSMPGNPKALNALSGNWGPSMRMVVEMTENGPIAFGITAGGPSGNPSSHFYDSNVDKWKNGEYQKMEMFSSFSQAEKKSMMIWNCQR